MPGAAPAQLPLLPGPWGRICTRHVKPQHFQEESWVPVLQDSQEQALSACWKLWRETTLIFQGSKERAGDQGAGSSSQGLTATPSACSHAGRSGRHALPWASPAEGAGAPCLHEPGWAESRPSTVGTGDPGMARHQAQGGNASAALAKPSAPRSPTSRAASLGKEPQRAPDTEGPAAREAC